METALSALKMLGESGNLRPMHDESLAEDMHKIHLRLASMHDEQITNMNKSVNADKKFILIMKLYSIIVDVLHFIQPSLMCSTCLRMVKLTLERCLYSMTPIAFAFYGESQSSIGNLDLASRLGTLALLLLEKNDAWIQTYKSVVICAVYSTILWSTNSFHMIVSAHELGHKARRQSGDYLNLMLNRFLSITAGFVAGNGLVGLRDSARKCALKQLSDQSSAGFPPRYVSLLHWQASVLMEGMSMMTVEHIDGMPGMKSIVANAAKESEQALLLSCEMYRRTSAFFFRRFDGISLDIRLSDVIRGRKTLLRPLINSSSSWSNGGPDSTPTCSRSRDFSS